MMSRTLLGLLFIAGLSIVTAPLDAQRPTAEQARELLRSRPDLVEQLRQRVVSAGMTDDEIRARLRAEGYPEDLLDPYLPRSRGTMPAEVSQDVISAAAKLGIVDSTSADSLYSGLLTDSRGISQASRIRQRLPDAPRASTPSSEPEMKPGDETKIFGLDIFRRSSSEFDPNLAGPIDANYRVGPGDRLMLILSGQVEAAYTLNVTREGFVIVPQVGRIDVANLTMAELQDLFYARLGRVYSEIHRGQTARTRFTLSPVSLRTIQIYVIGDVVMPGSYRISGAATALTALYAAGGPTATGTMRAVQVRRGGSVASTLDVYEYLLKGQASRDIRLENGDVVFVGVHGPRIQIAGEVVRPATYELKAGETLADVVEIAGGLRPTASRRTMQIQRLAPASSVDEVGRERFILDVGLENLENGGTPPPMALEGGDIIRVYGITERVRRSVEITGNVWMPGQIAFEPGMTLSQAIRRAGGVKPDVYLGQVQISRLNSDSTLSRVYSAFTDTAGALTQDIPLQEDDRIRIFGVTEFRQERHVTVAGAVRRPGQYAYRDGMTLRDLVLQAGGLHERALLTEAEVARMPSDRSGGRLAVSRRVPLDSSYLFERGPDGRYFGPPGVPAPVATAPEVELEAYDNVLILEQPDWDMPRVVTIGGEVRLPGSYTLLNKQERLADLIQRAGGLTSQAYPAGVVFNRKRDNIGRIGIDLPRVLRDQRFRDNLQLEDGDEIVVPTYRATVVVSGAVNSPVAVSYVPGRDISWYIDAAGGPSLKGDGSRAWVTQPNGVVETTSRRRLLPDSRPEPQPGSTVVVPEKDPSARADRLQLITLGAQVLPSLVAILAILLR